MPFGEDAAKMTNATTTVEAVTPESVDGRMVALMRLVLSLSALIVIYINPSEPNRLVAATYAALALYLLYSAALYLLPALRESPAWERAAPWVDVGCYLVFVSLSSGTSSVFFFFFFFAVLEASFRRGFKAGLAVVFVSAISFTLVGYLTAPAEPAFEWDRFLLRPTYLLVLGYMMAYWGGSEIRLKRQLSLLREVTGLANPRLGMGHTLGSVMKRLVAFYEAESGLLVWSEERGAKHRLLKCARGDTAEQPRAEQIPEALARLLRSLPADVSLVHNPRRTAHRFTREPVQDVHATVEQSEVEALAARLGAESFVTVPAYFRHNVVGRLYLTGRRGAFDEMDTEFLQQLVLQLAPVLDNIRLLERLAANAAEQERQRLARDIHDSVIQPYLGLQYRLAAIRNRLDAGASDVREEIERLFESTAEEVRGLRGFVRELKDAEGRGDDLVSAVRRFAKQFGDDYDIEVEVACAGRLNVSDRLAAEVIRFVHEGLSNVRKHARAARATVTLGCTERDCFVRIENDGAGEDEGQDDNRQDNGDGPAHSFTPRSLTERARELGGRVRVERAGPGRTAVTVEIPL